MKESKTVKCVVWDLDNTLWHGTLAEGDRVELRRDVFNVIEALDQRGVLHSIASKNDARQAQAVLERLGVDKYFIYPQVSWGPKSSALESIAKSINIGMDSLALVDDQPFEREEVNFSHPSVLCIDAAHVDRILAMPEMMPRFVTDDSKQRRLMYQSDARRNEIEANFEGPKEAFLSTLGMTFTIQDATEDDLRRAEELTIRTHQLNTTGYTYSYDELEAFRRSDSHRLLVASLDDKYGPYGKIGLALLSLEPSVWTIKLLLMSCRVMARGVGGVMITHLRRAARQAGVRLRAEFIHTDVNRQMYMTYRFANFREVEQGDKLIVLEQGSDEVPPFPDYLKVTTS
jgi:FkbH-like protein